MCIIMRRRQLLRAANAQWTRTCRPLAFRAIANFTPLLFAFFPLALRVPRIIVVGAEETRVTGISFVVFPSTGKRRKCVSRKPTTTTTTTTVQTVVTVGTLDARSCSESGHSDGIFRTFGKHEKTMDGFAQGLYGTITTCRVRTQTKRPRAQNKRFSFRFKIELERKETTLALLLPTQNKLPTRKTKRNSNVFHGRNRRVSLNFFFLIFPSFFFFCLFSQFNRNFN